MASASGPTHPMSFSASARGKEGYSDACPHPGHTASQLVCLAMVTMMVTLA